MDIEYDYLLGQPFAWGEKDCFALVRDFYEKNYGIEITNYARPDDWDPDILVDLFNAGYPRENFYVVENYVRNIKVGDVLLMAIKSRKINHCGVYIGNGQFLHHYYGYLSKIDNFTGGWRKFTMKVLRNNEVEQKQVVDEEPLDIVDYYPEPMRTQLREARDRAQSS